MEACSGGYTFIVQHLLLQPDINVNLQNKVSFCPYFRASCIMPNNAYFIAMTINYTQSGSTALHLASRFGKKDGVVKLLLAHPRIDVNKQDVVSQC